MWAFRRSPSSFKKQGFTLGSSRISCASNRISSRYLEGNSEGILTVILDRSVPSRKYCKIAHGSSILFLGLQNFLSLVGTTSCNEKDSDLDDGFSELESPTATEVMLETGEEDELVSEPELSEDEIDGENVEMTHNKLELSDTDDDASQPESLRTKVSMELLNAIMAAPPQSVDKVMDKWVEKGNSLTRREIISAMTNLRKRRMYGRALQLSRWLEMKKQLAFTDRDYACRVNLIAKLHGLQKAESYFERVPKSFRSEVVYRTLLANYVSQGETKKVEEIFKKIRELGFPVTSFVCFQLLFLYARTDKKKFLDVLLLMENENVKPSALIYKILLDVKGQFNDITGMEQIAETMKSEGIEPNFHAKSIMAKHYIFCGLVEKAENTLKQMEGEMKENRAACRILLPLYAALRKADDVRRIWQVCEPNARPDECMAAIEAWGKLHKIEEAEAIFGKMSKEAQNLTSKHYYPLLKVYANHKMLAKGKDLVKQMAESGLPIEPLTWDALVSLYIAAGEVEKADSILQKAAENSQFKPQFSSYIAIMDQYAKRGDIHNSEKILYQMRRAGYAIRTRQSQCLIQAYINAKAPCYGIAERLKADNIYPNKTLAKMLSNADPFKKTAASELLD